MQNQNNIPYFVRSFNKITSSWVVRSAPDVTEASLLGHKLSSHPHMILTSWGWDGSVLQVVEIGQMPDSLV